MDKAGLLTAIAVEGYRQLGAALAGADGLLDLGVRYATFAAAYPAHFEVMFTPALLRAGDADLATAREDVSLLLRAAVSSQLGSADAADIGAAWAIAQRFRSTLAVRRDAGAAR